MISTLTKESFLDMLTAALMKVKENFDYLNQLDSATGDGDHGTAILASLNAAVNKASEAVGNKGAAFSQMLTDIGWNIMTETSGTTSSLTGSLFIGMSEKAQESMGPEDVQKMFSAGLANVQTMTSAKPGDKTLMDALTPAILAMEEYEKANPKANIGELLTAAADAAKKGAEATKDLTAKFGRAKNYGERSAGHLDAGATSMALIFEAFAEVSR